MAEKGTDLLHPAMRPLAEKLVGRLYDAHMDGEIKTLFRPFETYRSPFRQNQLYEQGRTIGGKIVTNARAWESAHQFGLAMDLVPYGRVGGASAYKYYWDAPESDWNFMHRTAKALGFKDRIPWDSPHIEDPAFDDIQTLSKWWLEDNTPFGRA